MLIVEGTMENKFMKEILNKMVEKENKIRKMWVWVCLVYNT